jgi:prepilin-type N-terminal cleavage/methylation domain-containing protein
MGRGRFGLEGGGFTLVEVMVALVLLSIAMLGFSRSVVASMIAADTDREVLTATEASRGIMERLSGSDFFQVFVLFNGDPSDDPGVAGSAPGATFDVPGLDPQTGDPDGQVGEVLLPFTKVDGVWQVREDLDLPALGLPRDLSGDGVIDTLDHSSDYVILPARVRIEWRGDAGDASAEFYTVLMEF